MRINRFKISIYITIYKKLNLLSCTIVEAIMNTMNTLITILIQNMIMEQRNTYKLTTNTIKMSNKPSNFNYKSTNRLQNRKNKTFIVKNNRFRYNNQNRSVIRF